MGEERDREVFLASLSGLSPRRWVCVGSGFSREEVKAQVLSAGHAISGSAITGLDSLCGAILGAARPGPGLSSPLGAFARQEVLRGLLGNRALFSRLPELKKLRRQSGFYPRLDRAIQAGRLVFAHSEEEQAIEGRLQEAFGPNPLRDEVRGLAAIYENWLRGMGLWDLPLLLQEATAVLQAGWPEKLRRPEEVLSLSGALPEGREAAFWEEVAAHVPFRRVGPVGRAVSSEAKTWERWHTLDDAAEALAERLSADPDWETQAVLYPDHAATYRSIRRALADRGIPLADPRDPARLRWDETLKWALLPLQAVAGGFERQAVLAFWKVYGDSTAFAAVSREINSRGIRQGLASYEGGERLKPVHAALSELSAALGGKRSCEELGRAHVEYLARRLPGAATPERFWVFRFVDDLWKALAEDLRRVGQDGRRAPALLWLDRLELRLGEMPPPPEPLRARQGVKLYRLSQAPIGLFPGAEQGTLRLLHVLGLPPGWLAPGLTGDYWFGGRERDLLASELPVRSSARIQEERGAVLRDWLARADRVVLLDARYGFDGRERESILPVLREAVPEADFGEAREQGAHPRWNASFAPPRAVQPQAPLLPWCALGSDGKPEITATALDAFSRCPFMALGQSRWRLQDAREPEADLWADERGKLLHLAVRVLMDARADDGAFAMTPRQALERAWELARPRGLLRGDRLRTYVRRKLEVILENFCAREREYVRRSRARVLWLEDPGAAPGARPSLQLSMDGFSVIGNPDRIDETDEGIFVIDYKSSSSATASGKDIVELGYRLQLGFYSLAAQERYGRPAIGAQFVELTRKGNRNQGVFFKRLNGKTEGCLTNVGPRSGSLISSDSEEAWALVREQLVSHSRRMVEGRFEAVPRKGEAKECRSCRFGDLCGTLRRAGEGGDSDVGD